MVFFVAVFFGAAFLGEALLVEAFFGTVGFEIFLVFFAPEAALVVLAFGTFTALAGDGAGVGAGEEETGTTTASTFFVTFFGAVLVFLAAGFLALVYINYHLP